MGHRIGDEEVLMGRHFWVDCGCFFYYFLGGVVEGKRSSRVRVVEKFSQDERAPNRPVCVIYYMLSSGGFTVACLQVITKGGSSILGHPGQTRAMFRVSTTRRPVHTLTTVEGLLSSFHHGLHGTVGMIFYAHVVYVVICSLPVHVNVMNHA